MSALYQWSIDDFEALAAVGERVFCDWRHPRHIELIRGYLKERGEPAKVSVDEYLRMTNQGVFSRHGKIKVELIREEILDMAPINEPHEEAVTFLTEWSVNNAPKKEVKIRVQCSVQLPRRKASRSPIWSGRFVGNIAAESRGRKRFSC